MREITCSIEAARATVREQMLQNGIKKGMDGDMCKSIVDRIYYLDATAYGYTDLADGEDKYPQFTCLPYEDSNGKLIGVGVVKSENVHDPETGCHGVSTVVDTVTL